MGALSLSVILGRGGGPGQRADDHAVADPGPQCIVIGESIEEVAGRVAQRLLID